MSDLTTELNLALAVDDDDLADYLDQPAGLRGSLITLDGLFNQSTGHNHNGSHQGGAINPGAFADGSINGSKLVDNTVTSAKITNGTITGADIAAATITGANIATGTLTSGNIADGTITGTDIAAGTVTGANIQDGSLTGADLAAGTVTSDKIAPFTSGPTTSDWFRVSVTAAGIFCTPANQGIAFDASGAYAYPSADRLVGATATQTLSNKTVADPRITGEGPVYTTGNYELGAATNGKWRFVKAWGGPITFYATGSSGMAGPGATAITTTVVIQNGDSCSWYADGTYWWCI